jgi:tetratricopeptide (TPR) repeat protein
MSFTENSGQLSARNEKKTFEMALLVILAVFVLFLFTLSPTVTEEDSGDFTMASWFIGAPHPSGYPAFILSGRVSAYLIPFGSVAFRVNLLSAFFGALSCGALFFLLKRFGASNSGAFCGALLMALSRSFWLQSIITEVYSLNLLLSVLLILQALKWEDSILRGRPVHRHFLASCLLLGLGLSCHQTIALTAVALIAHIIIRTRGRVFCNLGPGTLGGGLLFLFLGLTPYLVFVVRSGFDPYWNWGDPSSLHQLRRMFFRSQYDSVVSVKWSLSQFAGELAVWWDSFLSQWGDLIAVTSLGVLCALLLGGFRGRNNVDIRKGCDGGGCERKSSERNCFEGMELLLPILLLFCYSILLLVLNPFPLEEIYIFSSSVFFIPGFLIVPAAISILVSLLEKWLENYGIKGNFLVWLVVAIVLSVPLKVNYELCDGSDNMIAYDFNRNITKCMDRNSLLFLAGDAISFPLNYLISVEGLRSDILPISLPSLSYYWYLPQQQRRHPDSIPADFRRNFQGQELILPHTQKIIKANAGREIYFTGVKEEIAQDHSMYPHGILYRLGEKGSEPEPLKFNLAQEARYEALLFRLPALFRKSPDLFRKQRLVAHGLLSNYTFIFYNTGTFLAERGHYEKALKWFRRSLDFLSDHYDSLFNTGFCLRMMKDNPGALEYFRKACSVKPDSVNGYNNMAKVLLDMGLAVEAVRTLEKGARLEPWNPEPLTNIGIVLYRVGNSQKAREFWLKALAEDPWYAPALENLRLLESGKDSAGSNINRDL